MFSQDYKAWHDACHDGIRGATLEPANRNPAGSWGWEVYQGELSKIKRIIDELPKPVQAVGMVLFAPDHAISNQHKKRVRNTLWAFFVEHYNDRIKSPDQCERALNLIELAIAQVKYKHCNAGENRFSMREVSMVLNCSVGQYHRDWLNVTNQYMQLINEFAQDSLAPIRDHIAIINKKYKKVA